MERRTCDMDPYASAPRVCSLSTPLYTHKGENYLCGHISVLSSTCSPCFLKVREQPPGKLRQMVAEREREREKKKSQGECH